MSSRFYFENTTVQSSGVTAIDSSWTTDIRSSIGIPGRTFKLLPSGSTPTTTSYSQPQGQPGVAPPPSKYTMHAMYEYTLPAGLLITGNMRGELAGFRTNNGNQISLALAVHIRNGGTNKATVISYFPVATNFFGFTPGHVAAFPSTAITDTGYITVAGDVLYVELGLGWLALVANSGITAGYNNANADWAAGDNGIADTNPTVLNPWIEFETTLAAAPSADDFLPTLSASSVTARPFSPSKPGLQFFARDTNIESIWNGSAWKEMVSSLNANGGTAIGGNITFANTTDIDVTLTGSTFTWNAQALSVQGGRTKTLTLTDNGTEGALLTAANTFSVNTIALKAPNATNTLRIGKYGNIAMAGTGVADTILFNLNKTDYNETTTTSALQFILTNTNVGSAGVINRGFLGTISAPCNNAAGTTTNSLIGGAFALSAGSSGNNNFLGNVIGYRINTITLNTQTAGTTVPLVVGFEHGSAASALTATRTLITDYMGFRARMGGTLLTSAAVTNNTGFRCEAITIGTNRYGLDIAAFTTGTPTVSYGVQIGTHSVGTTRRGLISGNTNESTANDFLCSTAAKGLITKDTQGTPRFWRFYNDSTGTGNAVCTIDALGVLTVTRAGGATGNVICNYNDTGTTAPAT